MLLDVLAESSNSESQNVNKNNYDHHNGVWAGEQREQQQRRVRRDILRETAAGPEGYAGQHPAIVELVSIETCSPQKDSEQLAERTEASKNRKSTDTVPSGQRRDTEQQAQTLRVRR